MMAHLGALYIVNLIVLAIAARVNQFQAFFCA